MCNSSGVSFVIDLQNPSLHIRVPVDKVGQLIQEIGFIINIDGVRKNAKTFVFGLRKIFLQVLTACSS
jgi:hypothetical protein